MNFCWHNYQLNILKALGMFKNGQGSVWRTIRVSDIIMVFNVTFNNNSVISWMSVLLVEETGVPSENHRPAASHWQTLSHNVVSSASHLSRIRAHNSISGDRHWRTNSIICFVYMFEIEQCINMFLSVVYYKE